MRGGGGGGGSSTALSDAVFRTIFSPKYLQRIMTRTSSERSQSKLCPIFQETILKTSLVLHPSVHQYAN